LLRAATAALQRGGAAPRPRHRIDWVHPRPLPEKAAGATQGGGVLKAAPALYFSAASSPYALYRGAPRAAWCAPFPRAEEGMGHFDVAFCADFVRGIVGADDRAALERHIGMCRACAANLQWLVDVAALTAAYALYQPP